MLLSHVCPLFRIAKQSSLSLSRKHRQHNKILKQPRERECVSDKEKKKGGGHFSGGAPPLFLTMEKTQTPPVNSTEMSTRPTSTAPAPAVNGAHHSHHYYPPTRPTSTSSASFRGCCCCLFLLFSFLALLILAVILVIVLAVKPKKPQFELQQVGVQYMGISPTTPSSAAVSLTIHMLFTAVNDNKVGIKYSESRFSVMYRGIPLGRGIVPGFYQPAHSVRQVETTISVDRVSLLQTDASNLIRDVSLYDRVELRVFGDIGAKIRILGFTSPGVQVSVDCSIAISPRKQAVTSKQCGFDGLSV